MARDKAQSNPMRYLVEQLLAASPEVQPLELPDDLFTLSDALTRHYLSAIPREALAQAAPGLRHFTTVFFIAKRNTKAAQCARVAALMYEEAGNPSEAIMNWLKRIDNLEPIGDQQLIEETLDHLAPYLGANYKPLLHAQCLHRVCTNAFNNNLPNAGIAAGQLSCKILQDRKSSYIEEHGEQAFDTLYLIFKRRLLLCENLKELSHKSVGQLRDDADYLFQSGLEQAAGNILVSALYSYLQHDRCNDAEPLLEAYKRKLASASPFNQSVISSITARVADARGDEASAIKHAQQALASFKGFSIASTGAGNTTIPAMAPDTTLARHGIEPKTRLTRRSASTTAEAIYAHFTGFVAPKNATVLVVAQPSDVPPASQADDDETVATYMLRTDLDSNDIECEYVNRALATKTQYWVESCSVYSLTCDPSYIEKKPRTEEWVAEQRRLALAGIYALFVDEFSEEILFVPYWRKRKKDRRPGIIPWKTFDGKWRLLRMFRLIVRLLGRSDRRILYRRASVYISRGKREKVANNVSGAIAALNGAGWFRGLFLDIVKAVPNIGYRLKRQISYCWIRNTSRSSPIAASLRQIRRAEQADRVRQRARRASRDTVRAFD